MSLAAPMALAELEAFVRRIDYPCVGAKSAMAAGHFAGFVAGALDSGADDAAIHAAIARFAEDTSRADGRFASFAVVFDNVLALDEAGFERALWARLQALADLDGARACPRDDSVSEDPTDPRFALSLAGEAFFAIGLHPAASRPARRFSRQAVILNPHRQFRALRTEGRYDRLSAAIVARDVAFSGSANPMLARHGDVSEARQYSGRAVEADWKCPFTPPRRTAIDP